MFGRKVVMEKVVAWKAKAVTLIQARIRAKKDRGKTDDLKRKKVLDRRKSYAAVLVQSIWRGKDSRRRAVAPSYEKLYREKQQSMYLKMDKHHALRGVSLQEARSNQVSPVLGQIEEQEDGRRQGEPAKFGNGTEKTMEKVKAALGGVNA